MNRIAVAALTASAAYAVPAVMRALAATLVALALLPASASAHTVLTTTTPERGARLDAAPDQVTLRFSEPVEAEFGAVRVFDAAGREVQSGRAFHPDGRASEVAVRLREGLGEDGYTATYRVLSADSHPVSGGFVFVVGDAAMPATTVGELLGDNDIMIAASPWPVPVLRPASVGATGLALPGSHRLAVLAVPLTALAALPALSGHAGVQSPVALLLPVNILHVIAMAAWLGGIAVLVLAVRAATARLEPVDRTRLLAAEAVRFSALATVAIAALLASGIVQGVIEVRTIDNLIQTAFGRAVVVKIALFAAIVAVGAVNRRHLLPALARAARDGTTPGRAGQLLRRTLIVELALGATALAATGALAGYAPPIAY